MDKKAEKIVDSLIEHRKTLWTALIFLFGGIGGLILSIDLFSFNLQSIPKIILSLISFFFAYVLLNSLVKINKDLNKLLK